jgi:hypothetical protein
MCRNADHGDKTLDDLRKGIYSASAQTVLSMYVSELKTEQEIVEIWTTSRDGQDTPLSCRLSLAHYAPWGDVIVFEGISQQILRIEGQPFRYLPAENRVFMRVFSDQQRPDAVNRSGPRRSNRRCESGRAQFLWLFT